MKPVNTISTQDIYNNSQSEGYQLIDVRSVDAYNGWKLNGEIRGGHIRRARSLPFKWLNYLDWYDIVQNKGFSAQQPVVVYGADPDETIAVGEHFQRHGFDDVRTYQDFLTEWSVDPQYPLDRLQRYQQLVSPQWLRQLIETGSADEFHNDKYVICHAHYQNPGAYIDGHIPGAVELDTNWLESPETWNCRSPQELEETFQKLGIMSDTTVILYGRFSFPTNSDSFPGSSAGHLGAIRCAFIMLYAGVKDVRILNGGLQCWQDAGYELSTDYRKPVPVTDFGSSIPAFPQYAVDTPQAKEILSRQDTNLVSIRSWREFIGEVSGYNYIKPKGRIPGAVFGNCGTDAYHMENYRNPDHSMREYHEIEESWSQMGITPEKHNTFYCGTGWRGSEAFMNAWLMGWPRISVYDGGWFEWSNDPQNPIETGIPENN